MIDPQYGQFRRHRENDDTVIILKGILPENQFSRFMTTVTPEDYVSDHTRLEDGTQAYEILGYAKDIADGQRYLYGRTFTA